MENGVRKRSIWLTHAELVWLNPASHQEMRFSGRAFAPPRFRTLIVRLFLYCTSYVSGSRERLKVNTERSQGDRSFLERVVQRWADSTEDAAGVKAPRKIFL
jgi:hypothetical protein